MSGTLLNECQLTMSMSVGLSALQAPTLFSTLLSNTLTKVHSVSPTYLSLLQVS